MLRLFHFCFLVVSLVFFLASVVYGLYTKPQVAELIGLPMLALLFAVYLRSGV
jgi:hypothetical protein